MSRPLLLRRTQRVLSAAASCPLGKLGTVRRHGAKVSRVMLSIRAAAQMLPWSLLTTDRSLPVFNSTKKKMPLAEKR